jgi:hypothetical protein
MQRLQQFIKAIWADWGARMSGPPTIPLAILALFVSNGALRILYASLAVSCGLYTCFAVWSKERKKCDTLAISRNIRAEWQSLQLKFDKYVKESAPIVGIWILRDAVPTRRTWYLFGARDEIERESMTVLLEEAGNFLLSSPWIANGFSGMTEKDPVFRWLNFLCEVQAEPMAVTITGHEHGVSHKGGQINQLPRKCSLVCAKLAAKETRPDQEAKPSLR